MADFSIDYSQIILQENIPLSEEEIKHIDQQRADFFKNTSGVLLACTLLVMAITYYFIRNEFTSFQFYHYALFVFAGIALFSFLYLMVWLTFRHFKNNWKKDIANGKNKLSSIIISRHKTENDEYIITFAGRHKKEKIRLPVKKVDYRNHHVGSRVLVTYLKHSKEVLEIDEL